MTTTVKITTLPLKIRCLHQRSEISLNAAAMTTWPPDIRCLESVFPVQSLEWNLEAMMKISCPHLRMLNLVIWSKGEFYHSMFWHILIVYLIFFIPTALRKSIRMMSKTTLKLSSWLIKLLGHPSFRFIIFWRFRILIYLFSEASPRVDESDTGRRDKMLKKTYKGLVNLRWSHILQR